GSLKVGVQRWGGLRIADDVFIGPNCTFTNDAFPRSRQHLASYPETIIRRGASIGANATVLPGVTIGQYAMVGAGAVVTHSVPPYAVVMGNPARIQRYVSNGAERGQRRPSEVGADRSITVAGVELIRSVTVKDPRGN